MIDWYKPIEFSNKFGENGERNDKAKIIHVSRSPHNMHNRIVVIALPPHGWQLEALYDPYGYCLTVGLVESNVNNTTKETFPERYLTTFLGEQGFINQDVWRIINAQIIINKP